MLKNGDVIIDIISNGQYNVLDDKLKRIQGAMEKEMTKITIADIITDIKELILKEE